MMPYIPMVLRLMEDKTELLKQKLAELKTEHRDLDAAISSLADNKPFARLEVQRLKKRKLLLKDQISALENQIFPDIIA